MNCVNLQTRSWVVQKALLYAQKRTLSARRFLARRSPRSILGPVCDPYLIVRVIEFRLLGVYWAQRALGKSDNEGKSLRRDGFSLAEEKYGG